MPIEPAQNQQKPVLQSFKTNDALATLFIDGVRINSRKDNLFLIRFTTNLPEGTYEQVRFMTDSIHLQKFIEALCRSSKYYPQQPKDTEVLK